MVEQPVKKGGGEIGVVGGEDDGALLGALADDLEQEVGAVLIDGLILQFVHDLDVEVLLQLRLVAVFDLGGGEGVDDVPRTGEAHGVSGQDCGMAQSGGQMGFSKTDSADKDHVGLGRHKGQAEEVLNLGAVDFLGPVPRELFQGFEDGEAGGGQAPLQSPLIARCTLRVQEACQVIDMGPVLPGSLGAQGLVVLVDPVKVQGLELFLKALIGGAYWAPPSRS